MGSNETATATTGGPRVIGVFDGERGAIGSKLHGSAPSGLPLGIGLGSGSRLRRTRRSLARGSGAPGRRARSKTSPIDPTPARRAARGETPTPTPKPAPSSEPSPCRRRPPTPLAVTPARTAEVPSGRPAEDGRWRRQLNTSPSRRRRPSRSASRSLHPHTHAEADVQVASGDHARVTDAPSSDASSTPADTGRGPPAAVAAAGKRRAPCARHSHSAGSVARVVGVGTRVTLTPQHLGDGRRRQRPRGRRRGAASPSRRPPRRPRRACRRRRRARRRRVVGAGARGDERGPHARRDGRAGQPRRGPDPRWRVEDVQVAQELLRVDAAEDDDVRPDGGRGVARAAARRPALDPRQAPPRGARRAVEGQEPGLVEVVAPRQAGLALDAAEAAEHDELRPHARARVARARRRRRRRGARAASGGARASGAARPRAPSAPPAASRRAGPAPRGAPGPRPAAARARRRRRTRPRSPRRCRARRRWPPSASARRARARRGRACSGPAARRRRRRRRRDADGLGARLRREVVGCERRPGAARDVEGVEAAEGPPQVGREAAEDDQNFAAPDPDLSERRVRAERRPRARERPPAPAVLIQRPERVVDRRGAGGCDTRGGASTCVEIKFLRRASNRRPQPSTRLLGPRGDAVSSGVQPAVRRSDFHTARRPRPRPGPRSSRRARGPGAAGAQFP